MAIAEKRFMDPSDQWADNPTSDLWSPQWLVDVGDEVMVGIAMDDGCYVVLAQTRHGQWQPTTHIPVEAAKMLGRLAGG